MKKCPFCKADIDESARFCLYCMNSLDEKQVVKTKSTNKKRWIVIISAVLVFVFALSIVCIKSCNGDNNTDFDGEYTDMSSIYTYRDAVPQDDFKGYESVIENGIVITGVTEARTDGLYVIPEEIDGKKVVAIGEYAFSNDNIKDSVVKVVIPETVKTLHTYAFYNCLNMTDAYLLTDALGNSAALFFRYRFENTPLTVHCTAECHNRDFSTYKSLCEYSGYGRFVEWNGGEL